MNNFYSVLIKNCYGVKRARSMALHECVLKSPSLKNEFLTIFDPFDTPDQFSEKIDKFIHDKGINITYEKPNILVMNDHYVVDVYFEITW